MAFRSRATILPIRIQVCERGGLETEFRAAGSAASYEWMKPARIYMFKRIFLTAMAVGALLSAACGSSSDPDPVSQDPSVSPISDTTAEVKIGNEVGNRLPDFELTLTSNSEKLTSTGLVESGRPAFLFFFATT